MGRKIDKQAVTIDGREMVAVRPADYERLDASRRQVGARMARLTRINQELHDAKGQLARIEVMLAEGGSDGCVRDRIAAILREGPTRRRENRRARNGSRS